MNLNFSMGQIIAGTVLSGIGFVAFIYGKKTGSWKPAVIGAVLMIIPILLQDTTTLWLVGGALTATLYFFRD